ncbi:MAG: hypothetical protein AB7S26_14840 [Sandaracinaceae bacterium]
MRTSEARLFGVVLVSMGLVMVGCDDGSDPGNDAGARADAGGGGSDAGPRSDGGGGGTDAGPGGSDAGGGTDAGGGGSFVSCDAKDSATPGGLAGTCTEYPTRTDGSGLEAGCTGGGGMIVMRPCEMTDAVARCTIGTGTADERVLYYYPNFTPPGAMSILAYGESRCMMTMGVWETF